MTTSDQGSSSDIMLRLVGLYRRLGIGGECSTECSGNEVRRWVSEVGDVGGWIGEVTD
jgi:hypothetical protein